MKNETVSKYTPGPWVLLHHTSAQHDGDRAVYGPGNKWICDMNGGPNDNDGTLANARLIAAAPELLAECKRSLDEIVSALSGGIVEQFTPGMLNRWGMGLERIISKAEGRI